MKPCPFCAESIQEAAIKCRYCGSDLRVAPSAAPAQPVYAQPPVVPQQATHTVYIERPPAKPAPQYEWTPGRVVAACIIVPALFFIVLSFMSSMGGVQGIADAIHPKKSAWQQFWDGE